MQALGSNGRPSNCNRHFIFLSNTIRPSVRFSLVRAAPARPVRPGRAGTRAEAQRRKGQPEDDAKRMHSF